ncbi:hypothetical protein BaRGS_00006385 [Batillaria attramentaria]|uniref:Uncharacterized protein n=1 Tax=Batillaria attramentaria TaxID=370345 RepID=A0ABD0LST8_9CAEN
MRRVLPILKSECTESCRHFSRKVPSSQDSAIECTLEECHKMGHKRNKFSCPPCWLCTLAACMWMAICPSEQKEWRNLTPRDVWLCTGKKTSSDKLPTLCTPRLAISFGGKTPSLVSK